MMQKIRLLLTIFTLFVPMTAVCADADLPGSLSAGAEKAAAIHAIKHLDPKYVCPMHPQIIKDAPGDCPICGMDLVKVKREPLDGMTPTESVESALDDTPEQHAAKHADPKYVCPMHPQIVRDEPGSCPICGMDLVQKEVTPLPGGMPSKTGSASKRQHPAVSVRPDLVQSLGIRVERVKRDTLQQEIRAVGRIDYDETQLSHVHLRADGWFEKLYVNAEGDPVRKGEVIGDYYAPAILSAQVDFLVALDSFQKERLDQARNGLRLLGVSEETILEIEKQRRTRNTIPVVAPATGIVARLGVREGMYATPATEALTIATLNNIWVTVDIFEHQVAQLIPGALADIRVPAWPGRVWKGSVAYIYPELDKMARTLRARLNIDNADNSLKPNMFAEVTIRGKARKDIIVISREALISTGERDAVIKVVGDNRFRPVDVITGLRTGTSVEIVDGLDEGDEVVTSGQFLIDSESSLQASFLRLMGE